MTEARLYKTIEQAIKENYLKVDFTLDKINDKEYRLLYTYETGETIGFNIMNTKYSVTVYNPLRREYMTSASKYYKSVINVFRSLFDDCDSSKREMIRKAEFVFNDEIEEEPEQATSTEPEQTTEHANKFYGYGGVHKIFDVTKETGVTMYTELMNIGFYPDNSGVEIGGFKYNVSVNELESNNGEHMVTYESANKFVSRIENVRTIITPTLKDALLDYFKFKHEQEKTQEIHVYNLAHDIKCKNDVDENDHFCDYGFEMEIINPNTVKVVNLDVSLDKKGMKYYIKGTYNDGTHFITQCHNLEKAIKMLCDYAVRARAYREV